MAKRPVHWSEGMFLKPHHFQAADRYVIGSWSPKTGCTPMTGACAGAVRRRRDRQFFSPALVVPGSLQGRHDPDGTGRGDCRSARAWETGRGNRLPGHSGLAVQPLQRRRVRTDATHDTWSARSKDLTRTRVATRKKSSSAISKPGCSSRTSSPRATRFSHWPGSPAASLRPHHESIARTSRRSSGSTPGRRSRRRHGSLPPDRGLDRPGVQPDRRPQDRLRQSGAGRCRANPPALGPQHGLSTVFRR